MFWGIIRRMRGIQVFFFVLVVVILLGVGRLVFAQNIAGLPTVQTQDAYWFVLYRKSGIEYLYKGLPGKAKESYVVRRFSVKPGIPGERPTPLPQLAGKEYWLITDKYQVEDNPETAPYFLTLNVPVGEEEPFGPQPYEECNGQCNWELPGAFGLHGVNGDMSRLSPENAGSSGCIRHSDRDITYLYDLLDPAREEIRYYVLDI